MPERLFYIMSLCHVTGKPKLIFFFISHWKYFKAHMSLHFRTVCLFFGSFRIPKVVFNVVMHQSIPAAPSPPPPRATVGHLPALSVPGVGHLPTPGPFLSFWHAHGFLSENNYTEDFIGKESRLAHLSRTGKIEEVCKGMFLILCMHFFITYRARIT